MLSASEVVVVGSFDYCRGWRCGQQTRSGGRGDLVGAGVTFSKYNEKRKYSKLFLFRQKMVIRANSKEGYYEYLGGSWVCCTGVRSIPSWCLLSICLKADKLEPLYVYFVLTYFIHQLKDHYIESDLLCLVSEQVGIYSKNGTGKVSAINRIETIYPSKHLTLSYR